ncbi:DUF4396 domain-containing protein [Virgibacillus sp. W0181]|uniref:DUF4396 domain-containing protein n=1 Tax=Virgibacillus sp. W0181 TaxID=3391581 RepID=UPI003F44FA32
MLIIISWIALGLGVLSAIGITYDIINHPQKMKVMNFVWPINGLFFGPIAIWAYYKWGRVHAVNMNVPDNRGAHAKVFVSTSHCAAGCTMGDAFGVPLVAILSLTIMGSTLLAHYAVEFILAYLLGIIFQVAAIYPMNKKSGVRSSVKAAIKADTLSLVSFEIGMFGWMAIVNLLLFSSPPAPNGPLFWFMMQIAMMLGFITSYPANWWLVKKGVKEAM